MDTICKIPLSAFTDKPTPEEMANIIAGMFSNEQAEFLWLLSGALNDKCGGTFGAQKQIAAIAAQVNAKREMREWVGGFVSDLSAALVETLSEAAQ